MAIGMTMRRRLSKRIDLDPGAINDRIKKIGGDLLGIHARQDFDMAISEVLGNAWYSQRLIKRRVENVSRS